MVKVGAVRGQEEDSFRGSELRQRGWNVWKMELPLPGDRETLRRCLKGELESVGDSTGPHLPSSPHIPARNSDPSCLIRRTPG